MTEPITQEEFDELRATRRDDRLAALHSMYADGLQHGILKLAVAYAEDEVRRCERIILESNSVEERAHAELRRNTLRGISNLTLFREAVTFEEGRINDEYERSAKLAREATDALARANRGDGDSRLPAFAGYYPDIDNTGND